MVSNLLVRIDLSRKDFSKGQRKIADYIEEHYGIQIDHDRYGVFYEIFGDNIMPQISVMEIAEEEEA